MHQPAMRRNTSFEIIVFNDFITFAALKTDIHLIISDLIFTYMTMFYMMIRTVRLQILYININGQYSYIARSRNENAVFRVLQQSVKRRERALTLFMRFGVGYFVMYQAAKCQDKAHRLLMQNNVS